MRDLPVRAGAETTGGPRSEQTGAGSPSSPPAPCLPDLADPRITEAANPATRHIDLGSSREIVRLLLEEDAGVPAAVARESDAIARLVDAVADLLRRGGRLLYVGAGTSGRLGVLDAVECPPTFGTEPGLVQGILAGGSAALLRSREGWEDDEAGGRAAIRRAGVGAADFVLGIAASGATPFVRTALEEARSAGAGTGLLSCAEPPETMRRWADILVLPIVGPEAIAGSTRLKAGTAIKLVLNALSTGVMIRLGKVYGNLMVDLRPGSRKLVDRSLRMLRTVCGLEREPARRLLVAAGGSVKTAIAMHEMGASRAMAERALDACDGLLREALERHRRAGGPPFYAWYPEAGGDEERAAVAGRLGAAPGRLKEALAEARAAGRRAGRARPEAGRPRWSPAQHIAHLIEFEVSAVRPRLAAFAEAERPRFESWEPSAEPPLGGLEAHALAERFEAERRSTLAVVEGAGPAFWERRAELGEERLSPYQLLRGVAQHDEAHGARIRERLHPDLLRADRRSGEGRP